MLYVGLVFSGLVIPTILIYLWLKYGVREYCFGCGRLEEEHDIASCPANTTLSKLAVSFGLTLGAWLVVVVIFIFLSIL